MRLAAFACVSLVLAGCSLTGEPRFRRPIEVASADGASVMDAAMGDGGAQPDVVIEPDGAFEDGPVVQPDVVIAPDGGVVIEAGPPCPPGETQCDGVCVTTNNNITHCAGCGRPCVAPMNAAPTCQSGMCGFACLTGWENCNVAASDGCEARLGTAAHCARCGDRCIGTPHAPSHCNASGVCVQSCEPGWENCDGNWGNGCEVPLGTLAHCRTCGDACPAGTRCSAVGCVVNCPDGQTVCGASCFDTTSSPGHCGGCEMACPAPPNTAPRCSSSTCSLVCVAGWGDCDMNSGNGCETPTAANLMHCGRCNNPCAGAPNARPVCNAGVCGLECNRGWANCDGNPTNGCETLLTSNSNCGACNRTCNLLEICEGSTEPARCVGRTLGRDCPVLNVLSDKVQCGAACFDVRIDPAHCGSCSTSCTRSGGLEAACRDGRCAVCPMGSARCPSTGQCCRGGIGPCLGTCVAPTIL